MQVLKEVIFNRRLVLFGTGSTANKLYKILLDLGYEIENFTDNNRNKWNKEFNNKIIVPPSKLNIYTDIILIASEFEDDISNQLKKQGFISDQTYLLNSSLLIKDYQIFYCTTEHKAPSIKNIESCKRVQSNEVNILVNEFKFKCTNAINISENQYPSFMIPQQKFPLKDIDVLTFNNGILFGDNGIVIDEYGSLIKEYSTYNKLSLNIWDAQRINPNVLEKAAFMIQLDYSIAVTTTQWSGINYYHWMFEELPRYYLLSKYKDEIDYYVSNYSLTNYQYETLQLMNIKESKIIKSSNKYAIKATKLIVPYSPAYDSGYVSTWVCDFLTDLFQPHLQLDSTKYNSKIYIARGNSLNRKVINEEEVINFLKNKNFEIIYLEKYSVSEQANIFYNAEVIIGPHGAGLANLVFCRADTKVLEVFNPMYAPIMFWNICMNKGLKYYCAIGERTDIFYTDYNENFVNNKDIQINIDDLRRFLEINHK